MKKYCFLLFLISFGLYSCSRQIKEKKGYVNIDKITEKEILFSSFVDSVTYIPLETRDDCLIGKIRDVIIGDSIIFVLNGEQNTIFLFDKQGQYLRKISKVGTGPGEYTLINQIAYNVKRQSLSLASSKIIEYDLWGNLKREFKPPFYISDLQQLDNGDFLLSRLERLDKPDDLLVLVDTCGQIKKTLFKRNTDYSIRATNYWELIRLTDGIHFISPQVENTVYAYQEDSVHIVLDIKILPEVSSDFYREKSGIPLLGDNYYRTIYRESDNWLNLIFCTLKDVRTVLYNKQSKQYFIAETFKNDMDDRKHIFFLSASEKNTFVNYVESDENTENNPVLQILHLKK